MIATQESHICRVSSGMQTAKQIKVMTSNLMTKRSLQIENAHIKVSKNSEYHEFKHTDSLICNSNSMCQENQNKYSNEQGQ